MAENNNQKIVFPENLSRIITDLTEKYQIRETTEEFFIKLQKGEETQGRKILILCKEIQSQKLNQSELVTELQRRLNLPKIKARALAKEIQEKILLPAPFKKEEMSAPRATVTPEEKIVSEPKTKKPASADIYREPIE